MDARLMAGLGTAPDSGAYTDLNRLNQMKVGGDSASNIKKVAQEFESLFLNEMLKAMRSANAVFSEGNYLNSKDTEFYQGMHDQQLAVTLAKHQGVGLADVLERQMSKLKQGPSRPNPFAQVAEGNKSLWPQKLSVVQADKSQAAGQRDDSSLINQRRLSLPGKLTDRLLAGIVPATGEAEPALAGQDWVPAQAYAAPRSAALVVEGADAISGRRIAQPPLAPGKSAFRSAEDFVTTLLPMAEQAAQRIGVEPRYLVAQAALETGWGKSIIRQGDGSSSHNLFGIKAHGGWEGDSARVVTTEYHGGKAVRESANFRTYDSFAQSFEDYVSFLENNPRYQEALKVADANPEAFVRGLQKAGYATDPQYARKISQIARQMLTYEMVASAGDEPNQG